MYVACDISAAVAVAATATASAATAFKEVTERLRLAKGLAGFPALHFHAPCQGKETCRKLQQTIKMHSCALI